MTAQDVWTTALRTDLPPAEAVLRVMSDGGLLDTLIRLTHSIDGSTRARVAELDRTEALRAQRDLVRAEVLRRMGDGS